MASATRKLDASQLSQQAVRAGAAGVRSAHRFAQDERRISENRRQFDLTRWDQQWERTRAERTQRDEARAGIQAGKADMTIFGGKGRADRAAAQQTQQEAAEAAATAAAERKGATETVVSEAAKDRELEAAKAGLKKAPATPPSLRDRPPVKGGPPARDIHEVQDPGKLQAGLSPGAGRGFETGPAPTGAPMTPRMGAMDQEMHQDQQRGDAQMRQALESTQAGGWISDPASPVTKAGVAKAKASAFDRIAKRERLGMELARAAATYRASKTKENKAELDRKRETNQIELALWTGALKRIDESGLQKGERSGSLSDWDVFRKAAAEFNVPNVGEGVQIREALSTGIPNKEFMSWAVEGQGRLALRFISTGVGLPDREYINLGSETMAKFIVKIQELKALRRTQEGGPGGLQSAKTLEARDNMLYETAARGLLKGMSVAPPVPGSQPDLAGGGGAEAGQPERAEALALPEEPGEGGGMFPGGNAYSRGAAGMQQREEAGLGVGPEPEPEAAVSPQQAPEAEAEAGFPPEPTTYPKRLPPGAAEGEPGGIRGIGTRPPTYEEVGMERPRTLAEWEEYARRAGIPGPKESDRPKEAPPKPEKRPSAREDVKVSEREKEQPRRKAKGKPRPKDVTPRFEKRDRKTKQRGAGFSRGEAGMRERKRAGK